jgi:two-component system cell cycle sensor histidine kinase/response regulator CckA
MTTENKLFSTMLSCMHEGVLVIDHHSRKVILHNRAFFEVWKIDRTTINESDDFALLGQVLEKLREPQSFIALVENLYMSPEKSSLDVVELKDGRFLERHSEPFRLDGEISGRIFFFRDVTEVTLANLKLSDQKAVLQTVLNTIPYSVFWKDLDLNYIGCNERFSRDCGRATEQIVGKCDFDMPWTNEESENYRAHDRKVIESGVPIYNVEESQVNSDGTHTTVLTSKVPLKNSAGEAVGLLGIYTDISEFRENQRLVKEHETMLVNAAQLSSLGEMAGGIAHEINNPLSIIKSSTRLFNKILTKDPIDKKMVKEVVDEIDETVDRIARIVVGLKNISRGAEVDKNECLLRDIVTDVLSVASERFRSKGIDIIKEIDDAALDAPLYANRIQLSQVLINLMNNAFDAVEVLDLHDKWIKLSIQQSEKQLHLSVEDCGFGIPEEIRDKMFNPFFTTKEIGKGTGLGLSISKSMIEKHGGKFSYDEKSAHTRFVIQLPKQD